MTEQTVYKQGAADEGSRGEQGVYCSVYRMGYSGRENESGKCVILALIFRHSGKQRREDLLFDHRLFSDRRGRNGKTVLLWMTVAYFFTLPLADVYQYFIIVLQKLILHSCIGVV